MPSNRADLVASIWNTLGGVNSSLLPQSDIYELEAPPNIQGNYVVFEVKEGLADDNFFNQEHKLDILLEVNFYGPKFAFNQFNANAGTYALRTLADLFWTTLEYSPFTCVGFSNLQINPVEAGYPESEGDRLCLTQRYRITGSCQYN